jgi:hypothetical protein
MHATRVNRYAPNACNLRRLYFAQSNSVNRDRLSELESGHNGPSACLAESSARGGEVDVARPAGIQPRKWSGTVPVLRREGVSGGQIIEIPAVENVRKFHPMFRVYFSLIRNVRPILAFSCGCLLYR